MSLTFWLRSQLGSEDFNWTTITFNHGWASHAHRDTNNKGPSVAASFGSHSDGRLKCWSNDDGTKPITEVLKTEPTFHDMRHQVVRFNGNKLHATERFAGNRISAIFFTLKWIDQVKEDISSSLQNLAFEVPHVLLTGQPSLKRKRKAPTMKLAFPPP